MLYIARTYIHTNMSTFYLVTGICEKLPCTNGGTCKTAGNTYNCECLEGYTGKNCETGMHDYKYAAPRTCLCLDACRHTERNAPNSPKRG